ncbi:MAG: hypothetical protein GYA55_03250, partial [SAR324 cluster bacterium]|nr:hypothetical protein [SAR324 cluster bacterium]
LSSYKNAAGKIESKEWDLKTEAAADAAAVLQTQLINIAQRAAKVPETKFSSDPKVLRGDRGEYTKRNPKWGQLDKFLMSKDAEKIGFVNIKGECRGQTTEQMTRMRVGVPAPAKPFSYLSNHPKFTEDGQAETIAIETSTTGSIPPSSSLSEDKQKIDFPSHRRLIPVIIPTIDLFFKGCPIGCDGGGLIPST